MTTLDSLGPDIEEPVAIEKYRQWQEKERVPKSTTRPLVYLAGPYSKPDPVENTHRAVRAAEELMHFGVVPLVPHLTLLWHLVSPHEVEWWYAYDLELLARCDALVRLPGRSTGAVREERTARKLGLPIFAFEPHGLTEMSVWQSEWVREREKEHQ